MALSVRQVSFLSRMASALSKTKPIARVAKAIRPAEEVGMTFAEGQRLGDVRQALNTSLSNRFGAGMREARAFRQANAARAVRVSEGAMQGAQARLATGAMRSRSMDALAAERLRTAAGAANAQFRRA